MIKRLLHSTWSWARPYFTWKMLPFLILSWFITNGWAYAFVVIGPKMGWSVMTWIGGIWISFLWMPFTIEKPITLFIAGALYRFIYRENFKEEELNDS